MREVLFSGVPEDSCDLLLGFVLCWLGCRFYFRIAVKI